MNITCHLRGNIAAFVCCIFPFTVMLKWLSTGSSGPTGDGGGDGSSGASSAGALRLPATISDRYAREAREGEAAQGEGGH